jgi:hypothetical protein
VAEEEAPLVARVVFSAHLIATAAMADDDDEEEEDKEEEDSGMRNEEFEVEACADEAAEALAAADFL